MWLYRMKKSVLVAMVVLWCLSVCGCHKQRTFSDDLRRDVEQTNKNAPQVVAEGVLFDSMRYDERNNLLAYYYTMDDSVYTREGIEEGRKLFRLTMLKEMQSSIKLKKYKEKGMTFEYKYLAKSDGRELLSERFTAEDYR